MCKGGLLSLTQYPPCAGRGVPSSMDLSGSLVAYNWVDPQGAGYCQKSIDRSILSYLRSASFKDHIATDMHVLLHKKSLSNSIGDYSPVAKALSTLDAGTQAAVSRKFEITYMMCKEGLAQ